MLFGLAPVKQWVKQNWQKEEIEQQCNCSKGRSSFPQGALDAGWPFILILNWSKEASQCASSTWPGTGISQLLRQGHNFRQAISVQQKTILAEWLSCEPSPANILRSWGMNALVLRGIWAVAPQGVELKMYSLTSGQGRIIRYVS